MAQFSPGYWTGNGWPSIDIEPVDAALLLPILAHLTKTHGFAMPRIIDLIDGYAADFVVEGANATILVDPRTFSLACNNESVRNNLLTELQSQQIAIS